MATKVVLGSTMYGTARPQIEVRVAKGTGHRKLNAALHIIAAEVELATPTEGQWVVEIDRTSDDHGYVYLDLLDGYPAEVQRGLSVLRQVLA